MNDTTTPDILSDNVETSSPTLIEDETPTLESLVSLTAENESVLGKFKTVDELVNGYINANKLIGRSIVKPKLDSPKEEYEKFYNNIQDVSNVFIKPDSDTPEELSRFHQQLGIPEDADGYQLPEEHGLNQIQIDKLKSDAVELKLSQEQFNKTVEKADLINETETEDLNVEIRDISRKILEDKWTSGFRDKTDAAQAAVDYFTENSDPKLMAQIKKSGVHNNAIFIEAMAKIGETLVGNTDIIKGSGNTGMSRSQVQEKITSILQDPDYQNMGSARYRALDKKLDELNKLLIT